MGSAFYEAARQLVRGLQFGRDDAGGPNDVWYAGHMLEWRHHGLGMLQAELSETLRIHIWHPKLVSPGMAWPRCVHDHRFDIESAVVIGEIIDVPCRVRSLASYERWDGAAHTPVKLYEIEHAKNQDRLVLDKGCSTAVSARLLWAAAALFDDGGYTQTASGRTAYKIYRRAFHTTRLDPSKGVAVSVVHRSNFDDHLARVCCAPDADVMAISGIVRDESIEHRILINWVLREAGDAIAQAGL